MQVVWLLTVGLVAYATATPLTIFHSTDAPNGHLNWEELVSQANARLNVQKKFATAIVDGDGARLSSFEELDEGELALVVLKEHGTKDLVLREEYCRSAHTRSKFARWRNSSTPNEPAIRVRLRIS